MVSAAVVAVEVVAASSSVRWSSSTSAEVLSLIMLVRDASLHGSCGAPVLLGRNELRLASGVVEKREGS